jgi:DNA-binding PadR family transcriptional regulator
MPRATPPSERIERMLPLKPQDYHVLLGLSGGERHGYGLVKDIQRRSGGRIRLEPANLYRRLRRLMDDGLVEQSEERPASDVEDERRRYYRLSGLGMRVLQAEALRMRELVEEAAALRLIPEGDAPR